MKNQGSRDGSANTGDVVGLERSTIQFNPLIWPIDVVGVAIPLVG
jgi:hypothetical protein